MKKDTTTIQDELDDITRMTDDLTVLSNQEGKISKIDE